jgi:hypothetical protein
MATSRRVGNYSTSAKAVVRASDQIFDAAMSGKPDFTKISKEAIKGRSLERRAVTKAEADVASAGLKAFTDVNLTRMREDTKKEIADIKRPAKRMAGAVAGLGAIAGGYVMMEGNKKDKAERAELRAERDALIAKQDARWAESDKRREEMMKRFNSGGKDSSEPKPSDSVPSGSSDSSTSPSSTKPASTSKPTTVKPTSAKGFRSDVYNYLTQTHKLSKNKALGLMANIDRESSFQINPQGGDGGNSFGMFQWNNTYGRSDLMKKNVSDWQTNWKGQIDYALGSSQLPEYNKVTTDFKNSSFQSPQDAADYWMRHWERPAHQERDSKRHTEILGGYNF